MPTKSIGLTTVLGDAAPVLSTPNLIEHGQATTVDRLNAWMTADTRNYAQLLQAIQEARSEIDTTNLVMEGQGAALQQVIAALEAEILTGGYPAFNGTFVDMHKPAGVVAEATTAAIDSEYGQALPEPLIDSVENQFIVRDSLTRPWVPKETQLCYALTTTSTPPATWVAETEASNLLRAFDEKPHTAWSVDTQGKEYLWLKVTFPVSLMPSRLTTAIAIHPFPAFSTKLVSASYTTSAGATVALLAGASELAMKKRWVFAPVPLQEVVFCFRDQYREAARFGCYHVGAYAYAWSSSAQLRIDTRPINPGGTVSAVEVLGPAGAVPTAAFSLYSPVIDLTFGLTPDGIPQVATALKITF